MSEEESDLDEDTNEDIFVSHSPSWQSESELLDVFEKLCELVLTVGIFLTVYVQF